MRDIPLIGVQSGDSCGISGTGETPQEHGFSDEEAHRPLGTEINSFSVTLFSEEFFSGLLRVLVHFERGG